MNKIEEVEQHVAHKENGTVGPGSELSSFNDRHCLLSGRLIEQPHHSIRCGRCCGIFHLDALFEICFPDSSSISSSLSSEYAALLPVLILPTKELLEQQLHEEWFCPFCLLENTTNHTYRYKCSTVLFPDVVPHFVTIQAFRLFHRCLFLGVIPAMKDFPTSLHLLSIFFYLSMRYPSR